MRASATKRRDFLARHWGREDRGGAVELRSDPRHKAANPYLYRIEEALACWRRITAPVLLVNGKDSHIPAWLKDIPSSSLSARRRSGICAKSSWKTAGT